MEMIHDTNLADSWGPGNDIVSVVPPSHGQFGACGGDWSYYPDPLYIGQDSFSFTTELGGNVTYEVTITNATPEAEPDEYAAGWNGVDRRIVVDEPGVLGNDNDPDRPDADNDLESILVSGPSNAASFALNVDGSFVYEPAAGFVGQDTFQYRASDQIADSEPVTVTINVANTAQEI